MRHICGVSREPFVLFFSVSVISWDIFCPIVCLQWYTALHLAIILEICGAVAFLHSLFMSMIVVSDKFSDAILVCLRGDSLRLRYLRCCATSSSALAWTSSIFAYFWYFQFVTFKSLSGCAMLRSQITILERTSSFGIKHVLAVNTICILLCIFCRLYLYMCTGIYTCVMFVQWL